MEITIVGSHFTVIFPEPKKRRVFFLGGGGDWKNMWVFSFPDLPDRPEGSFRTFNVVLGCFSFRHRRVMCLLSDLPWNNIFRKRFHNDFPHLNVTFMRGHLRFL